MILITGLNAFEHGGNLYEAVREKGGVLTNVLDFSANINPLGLPESIRQAILESLENIIHYPDPQAYSLKQAISCHFNVAADLITAGNGAVELLYILCNIRKPRRVLIPVPAFSEYERAARSSGAKIEYFYLEAENDFSLNPSLLIPYLKNDIDIIFLGNPNNPTGTLILKDELEPLLEAALENNVLVVVDESFIDFVVNYKDYTCRNLLARYDNLVILHSLTKFYAIPGLRLGFVLASKEITTCLHEAKDPWNVNTLAQCAGVAALNDRAYYISTKEFVSRVKDDFYSQLCLIEGCKPYKPSVNFILIDITGTELSSAQIRTILAGMNILVRDCSNYPGLNDKYIRVAVKQPDQNSRLINALKQICR